MGEKMMLWLSTDNSHRDLVEFLSRKHLQFGVKYLPPAERRSDGAPILFTPLGTFEGELSIRRAASVLA